MSNPEDLQYTENHEWVRFDGTRAIVGITDYAQRHLGAVVHIELPAVGEFVIAEAPCGEIESTKSVSEIYAPANGTVISVNATVGDTPELVNDDPYGEGWLIEFEVSPEASREELLSAVGYEAFLSSLPDE